jgi:dinuclear metal center YbgI/SA1388 family protein
MPTASLNQIVAYCQRLLRPERIQDYDGAVNGLQAENRGRVTRIAAAVDASLSALRAATSQRANLLLVHHGLFWTSRRPWTGPHYQMLRLLLDHDLAVYSSHLPLDVHPRLGNNARLCAALGLRNPRPFFFERGAPLGLQATARVPRQELIRRLGSATAQEPTVLPFGPESCRRVGVVTGGAGAELAKAASEGVDTFITGEGPHWTFPLAEELKLNVLYGGHYATETFGVRALAAHLSAKFGLPWEFLDFPSGL